MSSIRSSSVAFRKDIARAGPLDRQLFLSDFGFTGKGFICVGDAHRFIDPIYSFGLCIPLRKRKLASMPLRII